ncbi:hypothetical protein E2C01_072820 [Portunus trituberculatus]|uniref:Uncharacterized protein n=1 Tax=Portunus trituberculatus TaxID=210409 RepID=A0A5B7I8W3_PORTR|nr:hypothetical protein [Portunus trituberculatus]
MSPPPPPVSRPCSRQQQQQQRGSPPRLMEAPDGGHEANVGNNSEKSHRVERKGGKGEEEREG